MKGGQQNAIRSELVYHDYSGNFSNSGGIFEKSKEVKGMFVIVFVIYGYNMFLPN